MTVPTLVVGGWWNQDDLFGALPTYQALESTIIKSVAETIVAEIGVDMAGFASDGHLAGIVNLTI